MSIYLAHLSRNRGTIPLPYRRLSATLVRAGGDLALLGCGEGTQVALRERGWGLRRPKAVLVTRAHADHVLGLPGLLLTLAFYGKGEDEPRIRLLRSRRRKLWRVPGSGSVPPYWGSPVA